MGAKGTIRCSHPRRLNRAGGAHATRTGHETVCGFCLDKGTGVSARFGARGSPIFANELVLKGGHEKDTLMPSWRKMHPIRRVFEGLVLGIDPKYEAIFMGPDAEPDETAFDVIEVFASRGDANKAASRAKTLFTQRLKWMKIRVWTRLWASLWTEY